MKHESKHAKPPFQPIELKITFESQEEVDAFAALFNLTQVSAAIKAVSGRDISNLWEIAGADNYRYHQQLTAALRKSLK